MEYFIIAGAIFVFILIVYMVIETRILKVTNHRFAFNKSAGGHKITLLHFTDLHLGRTGIKKDRIIETIKNNSSDFLVFTGDYFEKEKQIPLLIDLIDSIREIYKKPIYLCFGNHDRRDVFEKYPGTFEYVTNKLNEYNITILENASVTYWKNNVPLRIIGLSDARTNTGDIAKIIKDNKSWEPNTMNLLITHNSDILMKMEPASVDFALAGHTHGAQIRTPFNIETKLLHRKDILSSRKNIVRGLNSYNDIDFYISRGTGCTTFPIRFISHPEIASITFEFKS